MARNTECDEIFDDVDFVAVYYLLEIHILKLVSRLNHGLFVGYQGPAV